MLSGLFGTGSANRDLASHAPATTTTLPGGPSTWRGAFSAVPSVDPNAALTAANLQATAMAQQVTAMAGHVHTMGGMPHLPDMSGLSGRASLQLARAKLALADDGTGLGDTLAGFMKEKVDLKALHEAGFGAAEHHMEHRKRQAYDAMFVMSGPVRSKVLLAMRELVKEQALADPDMCYYARSRIEMVVDLLYNDFIVYQEKVVEDARLAAVGLAVSDHDGLAALGHEPMCLTPFWFRAKLLYHYLPFDRSIFGRMKDPFWWVLLVISLVPNYGIRIIFFLLIFIGIMRGHPPDEYQLVHFILSFKGTQVISSGFFMSLSSTLKFYMCIRANNYHQCDTEGPGSSMDIVSSAIDFFGSCLLVWTAFLCLPCSARSAGLRSIDEEAIEVQSDMMSEVATMSDMSDDEGPPRRKKFSCCKGGLWCFCCRWNPTRGGRLAGLLLWDLLSFALSCVFLFSLAYMEVTHERPGGEPFQEIAVDDEQDVLMVLGKEFPTWQFHTAACLARILYATLSLPFLIFNIPFLGSILTHTTPSGYNKQGLCVPYMLPPVFKGRPGPGH